MLKIFFGNQFPLNQKNKNKNNRRKLHTTRQRHKCDTHEKNYEKGVTG